MSEKKQTLCRSAASQREKDQEEKVILRQRPYVFENIAHFEAPFFTRELLQRVANEVEFVRKGNGIIEMPHILGGGVTKLKLEPGIVTGVSLSWCTTMKISECAGRTPGYTITPYYLPQICPRFLDSETLKGPIETLTSGEPSYRVWQRIQQMPVLPSLDATGIFGQEVLLGKFWQNLTLRLDALTERIDNIVCVALGTPFFEGKKSYRSVTQHLLACSVSKYLSGRYAAQNARDAEATETVETVEDGKDGEDSGNAPSIPILAHDPLYTLEDVRMLSHLDPPITVVSDPYHYLAITPSTLFITLYAPKTQPILEIVADVCHPSTPAAILSLEIHEHPWQKYSLVTTVDPRTPRVSKMLQGMDAVWLQGEECVGGRVDDEYGRFLFLYTRKE